MTEAEWLTCTHVETLISQLGNDRSRRKSRLLACACCWRMGELIPRDYCEMLEAAERYADRQAKKSELPTLKALRKVVPAAQAVVLAASKHASLRTLRKAVAEAYSVVMGNGSVDGFHERLLAERSAQINLLRDIFGNPFRPVAIEPGWLTSTVTALAQRLLFLRRP